MRSQEECFEILDSIVRAKLEELADPAGTAARAAVAGVESKDGQATHRSDDSDSEAKTMPPTLLDQAAGFRIGLGGEVEVLPKAEVDALIDASSARRWTRRAGDGGFLCLTC